MVNLLLKVSTKYTQQLSNLTVVGTYAYVIVLELFKESYKINVIHALNVVLSIYLIGLNDTANEHEQDILLKFTEVARLNHSLESRNPGARLFGHRQPLGTSLFLHFSLALCFPLHRNDVTNTQYYLKQPTTFCLR